MIHQGPDIDPSAKIDLVGYFPLLPVAASFQFGRRPSCFFRCNCLSSPSRLRRNVGRCSGRREQGRRSCGKPGKPKRSSSHGPDHCVVCISHVVFLKPDCFRLWWIDNQQAACSSAVLESDAKTVGKTLSGYPERKGYRALLATPPSGRAPEPNNCLLRIEVPDWVPLHSITCQSPPAS